MVRPGEWECPICWCRTTEPVAHAAYHEGLTQAIVATAEAVAQDTPAD